MGLQPNRHPCRDHSNSICICRHRATLLGRSLLRAKDCTSATSTIRLVEAVYHPVANFVRYHYRNSHLLDHSSNSQFLHHRQLFSTRDARNTTIRLNNACNHIFSTFPDCRSIKSRKKTSNDTQDKNNRQIRRRQHASQNRDLSYFLSTAYNWGLFPRSSYSSCTHSHRSTDALVPLKSNFLYDKFHA